MPSDPKRVQSLFLAAVEVPADNRAALLDRECGSDAELRQRVEALLKANDQPGSFLGKPAVSPGATADEAPGPRESVGDCIGPYKLLQQIGEGGMGTVYMAEQEQPVRRMVALKIIKPGMDSAQVLARFQAERQALALMDHPNIARILDAGSTDSGRPFFVMELVKGIPITRFCDEHQLTPRERLALFVPVCQAVQHAHQKGIVHRDLKPNNVLIALYDDRPVPKVIDFGVAKATSQRLTEQTLFTAFGSIVGTLEYMSPEQARLNALDIDTRSDIYSLGVLLYELLTGSTPLESQRLRQAALDELLRIIREEEPPKPSTRLSESGAALPSISAQRKTEPAKLSKLIRGELDWIVMKALEKDRSRRYETANGLARDIERYLHDEPVEACSPSAGYRLKKLARRYKKSLGVAVAVAMLLLAGAVFSGLLAIRAMRATAAARIEQEAAERARAEEAKQRRQALTARGAEADQRRHAEAERDAKDKALRRAEGLRLTALSSATLPTNPGLALLLAIEGAQRHPGRLGNNALLSALDACHEERVLLGHEAEVRSAVFSPDGRQVLSFSSHSFDDATVRLWDVATGKVQAQLIPFALHTKEAQFSPDGRRIITRYQGWTQRSWKPGEAQRYKDEALYLWDAATGKPLFLLRHQDYVASMAYSPDGNRLLTASWDHTARLWDVATGKELQVLKDPQSSLCAARFSPDGKRVLTVSTGVAQSRYGLGSPRPTRNDEPEPATMRPILRPEMGGFGFGTWFSGGASDPTLARLWDAATGREVGALQRALGGPLLRDFQPIDGTFSPDGRLVLLRDDQKTAHIWEPDTDRLVATVHEKSRLAAASFSPDSKYVLTAAGTTIHLWDAATGAVLITIKGHTQPIIDAVFSPDGRLLATISEDKTCRVWDAATGGEVAVFKGHEERVNAACFSPDSRRVVTASDDRTIRTWQVQPPREFARPLEGHQAAVLALAFSPDGRRVATTSADKTARLWDTASGKAAAVLKGHAGLSDPSTRDQILGPVRAVQFSPDGRRLVTAGDETWARLPASFFGLKLGEIDVPFTPARLWDVETGKELLGFRGDRSGLDSIQFSPDGKRLLAVESGRIDRRTPTERSTNANSDRTVRIWNAETGEPIATLKESAARVTLRLVSASFSPDGQRVLTSNALATGQCPVRIWDASNGNELLRLKLGDESLTWYTLFSLDGRRILGFRSGHTRVWDAATGRELARFDEPAPDNPSDRCHFAALSPDGKRVIALSSKHVCVWDAATLQLLFGLDGHQRLVHMAAFSSDSRLIITASDDDTARIWDAATGEERYTLSGHQGPVQFAAFSPDGQIAATASADGTARLWQIDPLPAALARKPRELTPAERKRFEIKAADTQ